MQRLLLLLVCMLPGMASAMMVWSAGVASEHSAHGGHGGASRPALTLSDGEGSTAQLWLPTLEQRPLAINHGAVQLRPSGMDNYHLLLALRDSGGVHEAALRYHYMNGKPSGRSPAELIYADKTPLEIVPTPLTREHARYVSEQAATFMVRFNGQPLASQRLMVETSNGSRSEIASDDRGRITLTLPDDFHHVVLGRDNNPPADFSLFTSYKNGTEEYRTSLSAAYYVNPRHWQSQSGAVWSGLAGFVSGIGLLGFVARHGARKGVKG